MWLYYWGMTERQIELLLSDQPLVVYDHDDKKGDKKGNHKVGRHEFTNTPTMGDMLDAKAKFLKKHGAEGDGTSKIDMSKFFKAEKT